ncbi:3-hydroxybutyrate dehydrogenase [Micrococcus sp. APC 4021]|uniref:3-hydroxybutyrate dehydrogenase n=1 Tax=Micrococcus TaxID=1269 RepID=UPI000D505B56|nr:MULTISPECIES: 3-hydroxybutyrate dehydrogenase [Micrococcus]AWD24411.1 SDR family oxidoreductase [Micrococcus luteus]MDN3468062.1 3-hydroxybutyrate dehydrogenase [Micrococcus sp. APC 4021]
MAGLTLSLDGRRAVVTGGASGIGAAIARAFASAGATVTVADRDQASAQSLAEEIGGTPWAVDLSDVTALEDLALDADILVNNAGVQRINPIQDFVPADWRLIHRLMLEAPFLLTRAVLPGMYDRGFGRIINVSSAHGLVASPFKSAYVAAKHGLQGLTKVTALEGGDHGVTANCINPGYVRTPLVDKQVADQAASRGITEDEVLGQVFLAHSAVKRLAEPEEVAALAVWLASDVAAVANGSSYSLDGGWTAG